MYLLRAPRVGNKLLTWALLAAAILGSGEVEVLAETCRFQPDSSVQCEAIKSTTCEYVLPGLRLNSTSFPNTYGHQNQQQVEQFLANSYLQLMRQLDCSYYTNIFICSAVYPLCFPGMFQRVEPCRELCLEVKSSCLDPLLQSGVQSWPSTLDCDMFQPYGSQICVWNSSLSTCRSVTMNPPATIPSTAISLPNSAPTQPVRTCTGHLAPVNNSHASFGGLRNCVEPCRGVYFEQDQNTLVTIWTTAVSSISLVLSILMFFTYLLNYKTVRNLEATMYYLVLCYGCLSLVNLISVAIGKDGLICDHTLQNAYNQSVLLLEGLSSPGCSVMFSLAYYLTLCTWSWWFVLGVQWSLCALRCTDVGGHWRVLFHAMAWGLPAPFLLAALFTGSFSGHPVTQSCWVDRRDQVAFLIVPLCVVMGTCCVLLLVVLPRVLSWQIRKYKQTDSHHSSSSPSSVHQPKSSADSIQPSLLFRVSYYLIFHLLPAGVLFGTYMYDYWYQPAWEGAYLACPPDASSLQSCQTLPQRDRPLVHVYLAGSFFSLCMGPLSVLWLLRPSLLLGWRSVCCVVCVCGGKGYDFVRGGSSSGSGGNSRTPSQLGTVATRTHSSRQSQV